MAAGQQGHQRLVDHPVLAEDDPADGFARLRDLRRELIYGVDQRNIRRLAAFADVASRVTLSLLP